MIEQALYLAVVFEQFFLRGFQLKKIVAGIICLGLCIRMVVIRVGRRRQLYFHLLQLGADDIQFMLHAIQLFTGLFEFDVEDLFVLLRLGKAFAQLLLRPFLHIHIVIILQLPVVIVADTCGLRRLMDMKALFRIPDKMDGEPEDKSPQFADDDHG